MTSVSWWDMTPQQRQARDDASTEKWVNEEFAIRDAATESALSAARAYRGVLWALQDKGELPGWASSELDNLDCVHTHLDPDEE